MFRTSTVEGIQRPESVRYDRLSLVTIHVREQADQRRACRTRTCSFSREIPCQPQLRAGRRRSAGRLRSKLRIVLPLDRALQIKHSNSALHVEVGA